MTFDVTLKISRSIIARGRFREEYLELLQRNGVEFDAQDVFSSPPPCRGCFLLDDAFTGGLHHRLISIVPPGLYRNEYRDERDFQFHVYIVISLLSLEC